MPKSTDGIKIVEVNEEKPQPKKEKKSKKQVVVVACLVVALLAAVGTAAYFYREYQSVKSDPASAIEQKNQAETGDVLNALARVLLIDTTTQPTVARVEDPEKLKSGNPEFYRDVQKGDYIILFPNRAIIFRLSENKVINVAPIVKADQAPSAQ